MKRSYGKYIVVFLLAALASAVLNFTMADAKTVSIKSNYSGEVELVDGNKLHCQTLVSTSEPAYGTTTVLKITQKTKFYEAVDYRNAKKTSKKKAMDYLTKKTGNYCFFWVKNGKILRMYYGLEQFVG